MAAGISTEGPVFVGSRDELEQELFRYIADLSATAIRSSGRFVVAVSGGSLPKILAAALSRGDVETDKWVVLYADERNVSLDDPESNDASFAAAVGEKVEGMTRLQISPNPGHVDAVAEEYEALLRKEVGDGGEEGGLGLDLVLLGMGPDGHTASLFPGHALLDEKEKLVAPISDSPKPPPERVTLTLPAIAAAKNVAFVITGAAKHEPLSTFLPRATKTPSPPFLPACLVATKVPHTHFFLDHAAATGKE